MASSAGKIEELIRLVWCRQLYTGVGGPAFGVIGHGRANPGEGMEFGSNWTERFIVVPQRSMNTLRTGISMPITKIPVTITAC